MKLSGGSEPGTGNDAGVPRRGLPSDDLDPSWPGRRPQTFVPAEEAAALLFDLRGRLGGLRPDPAPDGIDPWQRR